MTSDIGMFKSVLPPTAQTNPTAPVESLRHEVQTRQPVDGPREAQSAGEEKEPLEDVVSDLNQLVRDLHRELQFSVDKDSGETVIKVIDSKTDEVLRQIPSEDLMNLRKRLEEASGVIFQDSA